MGITPQAIQDLLDELEVSKQSRLRAWNVLQILSDLGNIPIPPPAQKTFEAEGETRRSKVCVPRSADFGTQPSRKNAEATIRTLLRRCGKIRSGAGSDSELIQCAEDTDEPRRRKSLRSGNFRHWATDASARFPFRRSKFL
jgi:hypothetical protein